jgi:hypothetical protein
MSVHVDRSMRLSKSDYFPDTVAKSGIALHHTVGGSARSTIDWWRADEARIGTAYIVERDGTVFEVFDPAAWAYQFGLRWPSAERLPFERRFIGIEIASEGGLIERDAELYCFDRVSPRTWKPRHEAFDCGLTYRGYRWFDRYESEQLDAVARLVDELCARFDVPRLYPAPPFGYYGDELVHFEGVIGHVMVRGDKSDPAPDPRLWQTLRDIAGLRPTLEDAPPAVPAAATHGAAPPTYRSVGRESRPTVALSDSKPSRDFSRASRRVTARSIHSYDSGYTSAKRRAEASVGRSEAWIRDFAASASRAEAGKRRVQVSESPSPSFGTSYRSFGTAVPKLRNGLPKLRIATTEAPESSAEARERRVEASIGPIQASLPPAPEAGGGSGAQSSLSRRKYHHGSVSRSRGGHRRAGVARDGRSREVERGLPGAADLGGRAEGPARGVQHRQDVDGGR